MIVMTELGKKELRDIAELKENGMFESTENVFIARDLEDEEFLILDFNRGLLIHTGFEISIAAWLGSGYLTHRGDLEEDKKDMENFEKLLLSYR